MRKRRNTQAVSPKGGFRINKRVRWPLTLSDEQMNAWYERVDLIRNKKRYHHPPKQILLPERKSAEAREARVDALIQELRELA